MLNIKTEVNQPVNEEVSFCEVMLIWLVRRKSELHTILVELKQSVGLVLSDSVYSYLFSNHISPLG